MKMIMHLLLIPISPFSPGAPAGSLSKGTLKRGTESLLSATGSLGF